MFERPSLTTLISRVGMDVRSRLTGAIASLRGRPEYGFIRAMAGATHGLHGHIEWVQRQMSVLHADDYTLRTVHAPLWLPDNPSKTAVAADGTVRFTGTNGTSIAAGRELKRSDGAIYTTDDAATVSGGVADVVVTAQDPGTAGNCDAGDLLTLVQPLAGVDSTATVRTGGITGGTDDETTEELRARVLLRIQSPPKGGGSGDYVSWALDVNGVTEAWEVPLYPRDGAVTVLLLSAGAAPSGGTIDAVEAAILKRRPETAYVFVQGATLVELNPRIYLPDSYITPGYSRTQAQDAIEAQLVDYLERTREPNITLPLTQIDEAISLAAGERQHALQELAGVAPADVVLGRLEVATLGEIEWVT